MWSSIAALLYFAAAKGDASGNLRLQPLIPLWLISSSWASMYSSVWGRRRRSLSRVPQAGRGSSSAMSEGRKLLPSR
jgi:hypothetical protein